MRHLRIAVVGATGAVGQETVCAFWKIGISLYEHLGSLPAPSSEGQKRSSMAVSWPSRSLLIIASMRSDVAPFLPREQYIKEIYTDSTKVRLHSAVDGSSACRIGPERTPCHP
jgi:aspartate-semialdehyde dehydrogenase